MELITAMKSRPTAKPFDLREGDLIREIVRYTSGSETIGLRKQILKKDYTYRIDKIFTWVILTTRIKYNFRTGQYEELYKSSFTKKDYYQGDIIKREQEV